MRYCLLLLFFAGCQETILHDLDELRANHVTVVLGQRNISASKVRDGTNWRIQVERSDVTEALVALEESRILRRDLARQNIEETKLLSTPEERAHGLERKIALTLEQTLEQLPGVLEARVQLALGEAVNSLSELAVQRSASVLLVAQRGAEFQSEEIKRLVAGGSGLRSEEVSVLISSPMEIAQPIKADNSYLPQIVEDAVASSGDSPLGHTVSLGRFVGSSALPVLLGALSLLVGIIFLRPKQVYALPCKGEETENSLERGGLE